MPPKYGALPRINTSPAVSSSSRSNLAVDSHGTLPTFAPGKLLAGDAPIPPSPMVIPPTPHPGDETGAEGGCGQETRSGSEDAKNRDMDSSKSTEQEGNDDIVVDSPEDDHHDLSSTNPPSRSGSPGRHKQDSGNTVRPTRFDDQGASSLASPETTPSPVSTSPSAIQQSPTSDSPVDVQSSVPDLASSPVEVSSPIDFHAGDNPNRSGGGASNGPHSGGGTGWRFQRGRVRSSWMNGGTGVGASRGREGRSSPGRGEADDSGDDSGSKTAERLRSPSPPHRTVSAIEVDGSDDESAGQPAGNKNSDDKQEGEGSKPVAQIFSAISASPLYEDAHQHPHDTEPKTLAPPTPSDSFDEEKAGGAAGKANTDGTDTPHPPQTYPHPAGKTDSDSESGSGSPRPFSPHHAETISTSHPSESSPSTPDYKRREPSRSPAPHTPRPATPRTQASAQYNLTHGHGHTHGTGGGHTHSHTHSPSRHGHQLDSGHGGMHRRSSSTHRVLETLDARQHSDSEGRRMVNQYALGPLIGRGAYGNVEKAIDVGTGQEYAIKEFSKNRLRRHQQMSNVARNRRARGAMLPPAHPVEEKRKSPGEVGGKENGGKDEKSEASAEARRESKDQKPGATEEKEDPKEEDALALIRREVAVMKKLDHPNLVMLYEAIDVPTSDSLYLVLEYLPGGTLMEIHVDGKSSTPIPMETARDYFRQLVLGLEYLHENDVAHRDIKPDNILLSANRKTIKLCDFGVSEMFSAGDDRMQKSAGSPAFMSPEAAISTKLEIHAQPVDIWACGIVLYCMHRGRLPFSAHSPMELYEAIKDAPVQIPREWDKDLKDLIARLLTKDPDERIKMEALREHPWVTANDSWPMPSTEENLYEIGARVEDPTQDEISKAFTSVRGVFTVIRAVQKMRRAALLRRAGSALSTASSGRSSPLVHSPASESAPSVSSRPQDSSMDDYMLGSARQFQSPFSSASSQVNDSPAQSPLGLQPQRSKANDADVQSAELEVTSPGGMTEEQDRKAPKVAGMEGEISSKKSREYFNVNRSATG